MPVHDTIFSFRRLCASICKYLAEKNGRKEEPPLFAYADRGGEMSADYLLL